MFGVLTSFSLKGIEWGFRKYMSTKIPGMVHHLCLWNFPPLSFGRIHFEYKGCWVVSFNQFHTKLRSTFYKHSSNRTIKFSGGGGGQGVHLYM